MLASRMKDAPPAASGRSREYLLPPRLGVLGGNLVGDRLAHLIPFDGQQRLVVRHGSLLACQLRWALVLQAGSASNISRVIFVAMSPASKLRREQVRLAIQPGQGYCTWDPSPVKRKRKRPNTNASRSCQPPGTGPRRSSSNRSCGDAPRRDANDSGPGGEVSPGSTAADGADAQHGFARLMYQVIRSMSSSPPCCSPSRLARRTCCRPHPPGSHCQGVGRELRSRRRAYRSLARPLIIGPGGRRRGMPGGLTERSPRMGPSEHRGASVPP